LYRSNSWGEFTFSILSVDLSLLHCFTDTLDAGTENTYKVKIKNVASRDLTINPNLSTYSTYYYSGDYKQAFDNNAIEISAPSVIKAGEIANITLKVMSLKM